MSIEEKAAYWKKVHKMAADRGIQVYWTTWNIHLAGADGKYGLEGKTISKETIAYIRKTIAHFLKEFPLVKGFIVHAGENFHEEDREVRANLSGIPMDLAYKTISNNMTKYVLDDYHYVGGTGIPSADSLIRSE
ncbi:MAG: hypothetical protein WD577_11260 [Bacteroidales bacterium]